MDQRLKQLSYSSLLTLHACPRRYELYKLNSVESNPEDEDDEASITFATGHSVGAGEAHVFLGTPEDEILWNLFLGWNADLLANDTKRFKSFWYSVIAIQKLISLRKEGFLKDWEVVEVHRFLVLLLLRLFLFFLNCSTQDIYTTLMPKCLFLHLLLFLSCRLSS